MEREKRKQIADWLCEQAGCNETMRKKHFAEYVDKGWHPHPPQTFRNWWSRHDHCKDGPSAMNAWNCACYRDEYMEAKSYGATEAERPIDFQYEPA